MQLTKVLVNSAELLWETMVIEPVLTYQHWRCHRAKDYLLRHDEEYRALYSENEIVKRRNALYEKEVSTLDPSIPEVRAVKDELPKRAWPRTDPL